MNPHPANPQTWAGSRRQFLHQVGGGFAGLALNQLLARDLLAAAPKPEFNGGLHHKARVRRVIQLFMNGGVSQMDTFDYKPELEKGHGKPFDPGSHVEAPTSAPGNLMKSPFEFKQHGQCGRWVSSVFPRMAGAVDDMAFLMAMASKTNVHGPASYMMNTGFLLPGFPCLGAWVSYGLGRITDNLPTFVVLPDHRGFPYNQKGNFSAGFLPIQHQGTVLQAGAPQPVPDLFTAGSTNTSATPAEQEGLALVQRMNLRHAQARSSDPQLDARMQAYELAAKMQVAAPEALALTGESEATRNAYGLGEKQTEDFGRRCLLARRMIERGVRFVQVWSGAGGAKDNWDNHTDIITELPSMARSVDGPISALLADLKQRGLFEDTLVIFTTEFGRMPFTQGATGRDHNGGTFVTWLAGAGIRGGTTHGTSDPWAWKTAFGRTYCYDLHATVLHLMGIDHTRLTYRHNGFERRLTDVHGEVVEDILA